MIRAEFQPETAVRVERDVPTGSRVDSGHSNPIYATRIKRCLDLILIGFSLPLLVPVLLGFAATIAMTGASPLYGHKRIGRDGRVFRCWKLRTMVPDADRQLQRHLAENPAARLEWQSTRKLEDDPRVTRLGRLLRVSSLDELPQVWNILVGDMSFVGPRPVTFEELESYDHDAARAYCSVAPGLTGLWQVSGRNGLTMRDRIAMDTAYARTLSPMLDLWILAATIPVVLAGTGR